MFRRLLLFFALVSLLAAPAAATWSLVVVDRRTGEVAVASATCLKNTNLINLVPVIVVGVGGGAAQSSGDTSGANRQVMCQSLRAGLSPQEILDALSVFDPFHQSRQYGIANFPDDPITYTGTGAGAARKGVIGQVGDLVYAIQGNLLTGPVVVDAAEDALLNTPGDLGQKVMAGMQAARSFGGDGRCSCAVFAPTSCGAPPPSFEKSAHAAFIVVARMGDTDGGCEPAGGFADGRYHLRLNVRGNETDPDPVEELQQRYDVWRAERIGRPDGLLSRVTPVDALPADGRTKRVVTIELVDVDGNPLTTGGADVRVDTLGGMRALTQVSPVVDRGDGTYSFTLTASLLTGTDTFVVTAADELVTATLFPYLEVRSEAPAAPRRLLDLVRMRLYRAALAMRAGLVLGTNAVGFDVLP